MKEQFLQYEEPTVEVIRFTEQDVIRTSGFGSGKNTEGERVYIYKPGDSYSAEPTE